MLASRGGVAPSTWGKQALPSRCGLGEHMGWVSTWDGTACAGLARSNVLLSKDASEKAYTAQDRRSCCITHNLQQAQPWMM